jgi:hypothetical protein
LGLTPDHCTASLIRDERYKYVHFADLPPLFFDLENDPHEFHDLAGDPAHHGLVLEYAQKMLSWRMSHAERTLANTRLGPQGIVEHRPPRRDVDRDGAQAGPGPRTIPRAPPDR